MLGIFHLNLRIAPPIRKNDRSICIYLLYLTSIQERCLNPLYQIMLRERISKHTQLATANPVGAETPFPLYPT